MANIFDQAKQIMQMRREAKRIRSEIEKITATYSNGGITATFRGDFSLTSLSIEPEALEELKAGKTERFVTMLQNVINAALKNVQQSTQEHMAKAMKSGNIGDLGGLFG